MAKPVADIWYGVTAAGDGILRLRELAVDPYLAGDMWLLRGGARDLLVDSGTGIVSPRPLVQEIAGKPVLAVALNGFYDHAGGLHNFDERACHPLEAAAVARPSDASSLVPAFVSDAMLSALPWAGYATRDYRMSGAEPTCLLDDGEVIDLGGRELQVLHLPGVSAGSLALFEPASGALFTGDTLFLDPQARPAAARAGAVLYRESLARLRALPFTTVYGGHYGSFDRAAADGLIDRLLAELSD